MSYSKSIELTPISILIASTCLTVLISLILRKFSFCKQVSKTKPPPSPPRFPIIGNFHQIGSSPHRSLAALSTQYGAVMLLHLGQKQALVISSAQAAAQILKTQDLVFCSRAKSAFMAKLLYNFKDVSAAPYGEFWRQIRSLCVVELLSVKRVKSFKNVREEEVIKMVERIKESCMKSEGLDLTETVIGLANDVVCRVALGRKYGDRRFKNLLSRFVGFLGRFNIGDFVPWLNWINKIDGVDGEVDRVAKEFDDFLDEVVRDHQMDDGESCPEKKEKDFVDVLLRIRHETKSLDMDSIKAIILDMFAGGTDTTSSVLEWAMSELIKHPEAMKKLQQELRKFSKKHILQEQDLVNMNYLKAVIKETLRLHPPIPLLIPREARHDVKLMGYDIKANTIVFVNVWAIGRELKTWDEPEVFRPERFLKEDVVKQCYKFLPFGGGRRGCPGIAFAMAVEEIALANLVYRFEWKLAGERRGEDLDMVEMAGITIHRKYPLIAVRKEIEVLNSD